MYRDDMGIKIKNLRKNYYGISQRRLAKMLNEDLETIRMIEDGRIKNPQPQLILRIADLLDSFYMDFVKEEYEDEFLTFLDWGTHDDDIIELMKELTSEISNIIIDIKFQNRR